MAYNIGIVYSELIAVIYIVRQKCHKRVIDIHVNLHGLTNPIATKCEQSMLETC